MIAALLQGSLVGDVVRRTSSRNGASFVTVGVRAAAGDESIIVNVVAFDDTAAERLQRLARGATVAVAGVLELHCWVDREGKDRKDWRMVAAEVLSVHQARKRREREEAADR